MSRNLRHAALIVSTAAANLNLLTETGSQPEESWFGEWVKWVVKTVDNLRGYTKAYCRIKKGLFERWKSDFSKELSPSIELE